MNNAHPVKKSREKTKKPVLIIVDVDEDHHQLYSDRLRDTYHIQPYKFGDTAKNHLASDMQQQPVAAIISSNTGNIVNAERTISFIKERFPEIKVLAIMSSKKSPKNRDGILENLMVAGADHVVSQHDLGDHFSNIASELDVACQGRLNAYGYVHKVRAGELEQVKPYNRR